MAQDGKGIGEYSGKEMNTGFQHKISGQTVTISALGKMLEPAT